MHRITKSCLSRLEPISKKYLADERLGHELSTALKERLFSDDIIKAIGSPAYGILVVLQGFYLYLGHIEGHLFSLMPTSQAAWDKEFSGCIAFLTTQVERMKQWTKQQMQARGPQTLLVPCRQAVGMRERLEEYVGAREEGAGGGDEPRD